MTQSPAYPRTGAISKSVLSPLRFFVSPEPAGRRITAGFSFIQRIGKSASTDVWFPDALRCQLDRIIAAGGKLEPEHFPAQWAAVRQFELLQEAGNYKIYDLDATYLTRTMVDLARNMRGGGYRVTVASLGSYDKDAARDDLEILDKRLQDRIQRLTHMLYLEEQSETVNAGIDKKLAEGRWDYRTELPHVGVTLGARDLFRPGREGALSKADHKHKLALHFFDILGLLPQRHVVHDTAIGLQLPDANAENEWIYLAQGEDTLLAFNALMGDLFSPFDGISLSELHGHEGARSEIKASVQHMRGYGDRLNSSADQFYSGLVSYTLQ
jgi:hypothetical protein